MWLSLCTRESCRKQTCNLHSPGRGEGEINDGRTMGRIDLGNRSSPAHAFREARGVNCAPSGFGLLDQRSLFLTIVAAGDFFLRRD